MEESSRGHICHCLGRMLHLRGQSLLTISAGRRRTGYNFVTGVIGLASGLSKLGLLQPGEVVAIAAHNSDYYVEWMMAITYVGGIIAPLNYRWSLEEVRCAVEVVKPVILVIDESCSSLASLLINSGSLQSLSISCNVNFWPSLPAVLTMDCIRKSSQVLQVPDPISAPQGVALICFTSGTTGCPKGVALSHTALIIQSLAKIAIVGYCEDDVYLHTAPLCHIGGISSCIAMLMVAGCHVFIPKFNAELALAAIEQHNVTSLITVPAMLADLISFTRNGKLHGGKTVNKILNGGGSLSTELIESVVDVFPNAKIISAYGMTEACSSLTFLTLYDPMQQRRAISSSEKINSNSLEKNGGICVGKPAPHIELQIWKNSKNLNSPSEGSIRTRGLHVMVGSWDPMKKFTSVNSGWLDTGDVGWIDDHGNLWLVGRKNYRIKSGGENVYPEEVEMVLCQHSGVAAAVVVGIPDARLAEKVVACVSIKDNWSWVDHKSNNSLKANELSSQTLQKFCQLKELSRQVCCFLIDCELQSPIVLPLSYTKTYDTVFFLGGNENEMQQKSQVFFLADGGGEKMAELESPGLWVRRRPQLQCGVVGKQCRDSSASLFSTSQPKVTFVFLPKSSL
ncbi:2-succinylbenzoate--CoA ligase, chloroplastic/peroxisomal [Apostasia shenzhenica]|uniref:4-coumarate--CoA ligase n=1 Tax=Apostasia shenzhenica TaxID=1088818 RepID=A0A2H9ZZ03_9ASPA|nr:2-succinylbenzoate--CoA ligase, chloroplastic/peroxisomal [Apostasia shenzhenica]